MRKVQRMKVFHLLFSKIKQISTAIKDWIVVIYL